MKLLALLALAILAVCGGVQAQSYSIDWFKVAGGGGTSSNGQYTVTGTIGQADAGRQMSGGQYAITGGFWSLISVLQTPNSPPLTIKFFTPKSVLISWPSPSTGFLLQQSTDGRMTNWVDFVGSTNDDGTTKNVLVQPLTGNVYYRLKQ